MMRLVQTKDALAHLNKYMFSAVNIKKGYAQQVSAQQVSAQQVYEAPLLSHATQISAQQISAEPIITTSPLVSAPLVSTALVSTALVSAALSKAMRKSAKPFTPIQKDKLFWCFYIILKGYEEYEINRSNAFSVEKQLKIETVEKLKGIKEQLKELKLKRTELEDELVNKQMITLKGLCALCLVHNVSITYVFGRKYCEISASAAGTSAAGTSAAGTSEAEKKGIIIQNERKEDSLKSTNAVDANGLSSDNDEAYLSQVRAEYWLIENIQKPLKAPSAYTLAELQDICQKLQLETHTQVNEKSKAKPKTKLYEEILECI